MAKTLTFDLVEEAGNAAKLTIQQEFDRLNAQRAFGQFAKEPMDPSTANLHLVRGPLGEIGMKISCGLFSILDGISTDTTPEQIIGETRDWQLAKIQACDQGIMLSQEGLPPQLLRMRAQMTLLGIARFAEVLGINIPPPDKVDIQGRLEKYKQELQHTQSAPYVNAAPGLPIISNKAFDMAVKKAVGEEVQRAELAAHNGYHLGGDQIARLKMQVELWRQNYQKDYDTCAYIEHKEKELALHPSNMINRGFLSILRRVRESLDFPTPESGMTR